MIMIEIHGPSYKYTGEVLDKPEIIFVRDHHYSEEDQCFHIQKLLENSTCDPHLHTLLLDHVLIHDDVLKDYNIILCPTFIAREERDFNQQLIEVDWNKRQCTFNFMINKSRPHRVRLLRLVEELNLTNYTYSLPWIENPYTRLPVTNYMIGTEIQLPHGIRSGNILNSQNYKQLLQKTVFEPSCISLITEPVFIERESILTEKTIMSVYSGTLPIWVGGWRCADALRSFGFDVFDDIIDHSYQSLEDPIKRIDKSIERNLDLLQDFDLVNKFVQNNKSRFEHNLNLLKNNVFQKTVDQVKIYGT
jgi:hypothetical protein